MPEITCQWKRIYSNIGHRFTYYLGCYEDLAISENKYRKLWRSFKHCPNCGEKLELPKGVN